MTAFTVTATAGGSTATGIAGDLVVVTGQAGTPVGTVASATQTTPSLSINPAATGSWVYGSILGLGSGSISAVSGTTIKQSVGGGGLAYISVRSTGTTTSGTPETIGVTSGSNGISICLAEIEASGTLAEDASSPGGTGYHAATTVTTSSFTPPTGSLLVFMVQANGGGGAATMAISDTSGLGMTWTEQDKQNGAGNGYSGVWTTVIPSGPPVEELSAAAVAASAVMKGSTAAIYDAVIAPAAPATGVTVINAHRDAVVVITGGTVTAVTVDGTSLGAPVTFAVPAYGSLAVTYTGTLTWQWVLLGAAIQPLT